MWQHFSKSEELRFLIISWLKGNDLVDWNERQKKNLYIKITEDGN